MKFYKKILIIVFLIIVYIYICNISMMQNDIVLMQGDLLNLDTLFGINVKGTETMEASSSLNNSIVNETGKMNLELSLFNLFPVKDVTVNVIPKTTVMPKHNPINTLFISSALIMLIIETTTRASNKTARIIANIINIFIHSTYTRNSDTRNTFSLPHFGQVI